MTIHNPFSRRFEEFSRVIRVSGYCWLKSGGDLKPKVCRIVAFWAVFLFKGPWAVISSTPGGFRV